MKKILISAVIFSFILLCSFIGVAERFNQSGNQNKQSEGSIKVETAYDKEKDETYVLIPFMVLKKEPAYERLHSEKLEMSVFFTYPGQKLITPKTVGIAFKSSTTGTSGHFSEKKDLIVTLDGVRLSLGKLEIVKRTNYGADPEYIDERATITIPAEDFLRIAKSNEVKIQVGDIKLKLAKEHLAALRSLATAMQP
jgi:hypothetical protein